MLSNRSKIIFLGVISMEMWYPAKLLCFYHLLPNAGDDSTQFQVLARCVQYQQLDSETYSRRSLLQLTWLYHEVAAGRNPRPFYWIVGSIKSDICVRQHIFAVEENPGFQEHYHSEEDKRIWVISDGRIEKPHIVTSDPMSVGCNVYVEEDGDSW
jgi:hypothetical protein